jgi:hypothetical protein
MRICALECFMNKIEMGQKHREQEYLLSGIGVMKVVDELNGSLLGCSLMPVSC